MINSFEKFLQGLDIQKSCELNKPIYKKMFLDSYDGKRGTLDATDKKCLKDDVDKFRWLYTLKPSTINIAPYNDSQREYPEVAVIHVGLSRPERFKRIAHFINRSIPYPLVLLFTCDIERQASLAISLADKRTNQADKEKWVIEDSIQTDWVDLSDQTNAETEFLASLTISNLPFQNFWKFYQALSQRVIAINCANHSGNFSLGDTSQSTKANDRLAMLRDLEKLDVEKSEVANKLKKEKQMGRQNIEDGLSRRYVCVQLPEPTYEIEDGKKQPKKHSKTAFESGYETIAEISRERIKRSSKLLAESHPDIDIGFRAFKLANSNIQSWNPDCTDLEETLLSHEEHLIKGRSEQDVLYELLLKRGVDLAVPIETRQIKIKTTEHTKHTENNIQESSVSSVYSVVKNLYSIGYGVLFACLDESITREQVEDIAQAIIDWHSELAPSSETHVFFRDSAFRDDVSKTNMAAILEQNGINHVRSL